jgi:hypothetical protein
MRSKCWLWGFLVGLKVGFEGFLVEGFDEGSLFFGFDDGIETIGLNEGLVLGFKIAVVEFVVDFTFISKLAMTIYNITNSLLEIIGNAIESNNIKISHHPTKICK